MNSTLQSMRRSRASLPKVREEEGPRISEIIFWIVAIPRSLVWLEGGREVHCDCFKGRADTAGEWASVPLGRERSSLPTYR
jgi:hypothetical protein